MATHNPKLRLLILACSATKNGDPGEMAAEHRYIGPLWQTWRAVDPMQRCARLSVLSAEYGWVHPGEKIPVYDRKLDRVRADQMIGGGIQTLWGSASGTPPIRWLHELHRANGWLGIEEVAIVGGKEYVRVARALVAEAQDERAQGMIRFDARVTIINGAIGCMRRDMANWLKEAWA